MRYLLASLFLLLSASALHATEAPLTYDRITLTASAGAEVDNDILACVLYAEREGNDAAGLSRQVNRLIAKAAQQAKTAPGIRAQTLNYNTSPIYRNSTISGWRVRQSIRLESQDSATLSNLIGLLQQELSLGSISYAISPERRRQHMDRLIAEAIAAFRSRAAMITKEMGRSGYRLVQMQVNSSRNNPRPYQLRALAMTDTAPPPTLEAGSQRLNVTINGTIELKP